VRIHGKVTLWYVCIKLCSGKKVHSVNVFVVVVVVIVVAVVVAVVVVVVVAAAATATATARPSQLHTILSVTQQCCYGE
jgi:flagellar basal body-associated protein FliL